MSVLDYAMMIEDSHVDTRIIEYRRRGIDSGITGRGEGDLIAVCLTDEMSDGLSMVYSFYDPALQDNSLGTFIILDHIRRAKAHGPALPLSRLLGRWFEEDGLQGALHAAGTAAGGRLGAGGVDARL